LTNTIINPIVFHITTFKPINTMDNHNTSDELPWYMVKLKLQIGEYEKTGKHFVQSDQLEHSEQSAIEKAIENEAHISFTTLEDHEVENGCVTARSDANGEFYYSVSSITKITDPDEITTLKKYI